MFKVISNSWALFLGLGLIMLGNGLQGSLLGLRASMEGFGVTATGLVMSGYFIGLLVGSTVVPGIVARVGHIRSFGAMASLASTSILVHVVVIEPWTWWAMRFVTGFAYAGLYIVAESWLNDASENETRGQLLSFYMLISLAGLAGGQFMLNIANPSSYELFVLISVLVSFAVIPILLSVSKAPDFETSESVNLLQLYRVSPLGVMGMLVNGLTMGAIFGMGAVYAANIGLSVKEISFFMGALVLGGALLQLPIGRLSDIVGRRQVIIGTCAAGVVVSFIASRYDGTGWMLYFLIALIGGVSTPLYALCIAHTNDYLNPGQMVAASGTLVLAMSIGSSLGAPITALAMDVLGDQAFFQSIAISMALICIFGVWRSTQRQAIATEDTNDFVIMAPTPMSAVMNPEFELEELLAASEADAEEIQESFEDLVTELAAEETEPDQEP
ncbi:MAG: MFS transporter [Alphaproteobacteria bacterium]|nr:MFS transporter [Alphaproteobacteria bacterium]MBT7745306.1 MFS transporter [Alphaproteobacteria bacterium]